MRYYVSRFFLLGLKKLSIHYILNKILSERSLFKNSTDRGLYFYIFNHIAGNHIGGDIVEISRV